MSNAMPKTTIQQRIWLAMCAACKWGKYLLLFGCGLAILGILYFLFLLPNHLDPHGGASRDCFNEAIPSVSANGNLVISGHHTLCGDSAVYLYLHKPGEAESSSSLVFRYFDEPTEKLPRIEWLNNHVLQISVGKVSQITKMRTTAEGVQIKYVIGEEKYSRDSWQERNGRLKNIAVLLAVVFLLLIYACKLLLKSIRSKENQEQGTQAG